jgi:hypothetical protein
MFDVNTSLSAGAGPSPVRALLGCHDAVLPEADGKLRQNLIAT